MKGELREWENKICPATVGGNNYRAGVRFLDSLNQIKFLCSVDSRPAVGDIKLAVNILRVCAHGVQGHQ